ncbi:MAG TPA: hypothetical protein VMX18_01610 [Candidatus Bipolaricaulota bacterium]|nr:hypothetical protein [Candidatus Bipolaricaulota bacterium]
MKERQKELLKNLTNHYIKTAEPVASGFLVGKLKDEVSSATVRNEMAELEKAGFIYQPHTSAGRIPTELGYKFYLENFIKGKKLQSAIAEKIKKQKKIMGKDVRQGLKEIAKIVAEASGDAVIVAFAENDVYYTGLSNLFSKPEFEERNLIFELSSVLDELDKVIFNIFKERIESKDIKIEIGKENRFSEACGSAMIPVKNHLIVILGATRMDYENNLSLLKFLTEELN